MKVNVGSGQFPIDGYTNIDMHEESADIQSDFRNVHLRDVEEIVASHVLEHLPWPEIHDAIAHLHGWLKPGGTLIIEVPDMEEIMKWDIEDLWWVSFIYGAQTHEGEFHKSGFSHSMLVQMLEAHKFVIINSRTFRSKLSHRNGYPCIEVVARKRWE